MPQARALDKAKLKREIERDRREKQRARLAELRQLIIEARAARDLRIREIRDDCKQKRAELKQSCDLRKSRARAQGRAELDERRRTVREEQLYEKQLRGPSARAKGTVRSTRRERGRESDDEVRGNLDPALVPVFDTVRRAIKGSPRMSRTEAFLHWAHENPDQVYEIQNRQAERDVADLIAEYHRTERELRKPRARRELAAVPF